MDRQLIPLGHRGSVVATIRSGQAVSLSIVGISITQKKRGEWPAYPSGIPTK